MTNCNLRAIALDDVVMSYFTYRSVSVNETIIFDLWWYWIAGQQLQILERYFSGIKAKHGDIMRFNSSKLIYNTT